MSKEIRFHCTGCNLELSAPENLLGIFICCDHCDTKQQVVDSSKKKSFSTPKKRPMRRRPRQSKNKLPLVIFLILIAAASFYVVKLKPLSPVEVATHKSTTHNLATVPFPTENTKMPTAQTPKVSAGNPIVQTPKVKVPHSIKGFLEKRCQSCHGEKKQKGDQRFDQLPETLSKTYIIQVYQDILDAVNLGDMPPEDEPEIPAEELTNFIDELTTAISKAKEYSLNRGQNPPMRYLNKRELKLTYRDLLGVKVELNQMPDAPETSRFDTISQNQFFSETHWEASFNIAKANLQKALAAEEQTKTFKLKYESETNKIENLKKTIIEAPGKILEYTKNLAVETVTQKKGHLNNFIKNTKKELEFAKRQVNNPLFKTGYTYSENELLMKLLGLNIYKYDSFKHGRYRLKVRCGTVHDKPDQQSFISTADHKQLINPEYQPYENFYQEVKGTPEKPETLTFHWEFGPQGSGRQLRIDSDATIWLDWVELEGPITPDYLAKDEIKFLSQYNSWDIPRALKIVKNFASKAYRSKDISAAQFEGIKAYLTNQQKVGASAKESLTDVFATILSSPEFLYLISETVDQQAKQLNSLSLANKLSYFLWSTQPDSKLLGLAARENLKQDKILEECDRMLDSERAYPFIDAFTFQWLELSRFVSTNPNIHAKRTNLIHWPRKHFFMLREPIEAMKHIVKNNLPITDMLNPNYYFINNTLAKYYGLPLAKEKGYSARPLLADNPRGGLSSHAAFLFMTSRGNRTSPVERGVYLLRNVLFKPPAPAPPNVPDLSSSIKQTLDQRFRLKKLNLSKSRQLMMFHTTQPQCKSCHRNFDPLGLALEGFDHYGSWQGEKTNNKTELPSGFAINGASGLKTYLIDQQEAFIKGFIKTLMSYAIHRPVSIVDQAEMDKIYKMNKASGFKARDIIKSIVTSKSFGGS